MSSWKNNLSIQYHFTGINIVWFLEVRLEVQQYETENAWQNMIWFKKIQQINNCR
jgi:hypothetical protein